MTRLSELLSTLPMWRTDDPTDLEITGISIDSSTIKPAELFVPLLMVPPEIRNDPAEAARRGAAAIVADGVKPRDLDPKVTWVEVPETVLALGRMFSRHLGHPSRAVQVLAVTGTNGKSTVAWLLRKLLRASGLQPGLLGTVEYSLGDEVRPSFEQTTPPSHQLQPLLLEMRDRSITHVAMEACAQSMTLGHMHGTQVAVGGFTNLTRETLDFFGTMDIYKEAKWLLFTEAAKACFNIDDPIGAEFASRFSRDQLTVSPSGATADIRACDVIFGSDGVRARLVTPNGDFPLRCRLIGRYNLENVLVALGMGQLAGLDMRTMVAAIETATAPPGRLDRIAGPRSVYVDFAHTPDALAQVLSALKPHCRGRLLCVFSACGGCDRGKRPEMGAAVARHAEVLIVTSDSPRYEPPGVILRELLDGVPREVHVVVEPDRAEAISRAVMMTGPEDVLVIAGKGHEKQVEAMGQTVAFSDQDVARAAMKKLFG